MRVALDAMGGDAAPGPIVAGAVQAVAADPDLTIVLVGDRHRVEAELAAREAVDARTTTVHVLSDHGLAPVHTAIDANAVLKTAGLLRTTADGKVDPASTQAASFGSGAIAHIYVNLAGREPGGIVSPEEKDEVVRRMREIFGSLRAGEDTPIARVLTPAELAPLGLAHARGGDLVLFAASGYWFSMSRPMASNASRKRRWLSVLIRPMISCKCRSAAVRSSCWTCKALARVSSSANSPSASRLTLPRRASFFFRSSISASGATPSLSAEASGRSWLNRSSGVPSRVVIL